MLAALKSLTLLAIVLFCYGGKSVCQEPVRPKPAKILRLKKQPCRYKKQLPRISKQYMDKKIE